MTRRNPPITVGSKTCKWCLQHKPVSAFHAHGEMKDGRLNKCSECVQLSVDKWRERNPKARKLEHRRYALKHAIKTREEWRQSIAANAAGRKATCLKYLSKRRRQTRQMPVWDSEFNDFAIQEAARLVALRNASTGIQWSVDHIIPINHPMVTGLHNGFNLNVVPAVWNSMKGNRHTCRFFGA